MRLQRIRVHNFKCFKNAELNLRDSQSITVIGSNGAGKSTLVIDALTWCLYGKTSLTDLKGYKQDDLVRTGEKECYVETEFELGADIYVVKRTFNVTRKAAFLDVFLNKKRLDLKVKDAERFLGERMGLDYEGFVNSTIIRQEEMKRLISEDPSKRKDIFISLFRLGIYDEALKKTKDNRTEAEEKLSDVKNTLGVNEKFVGQEKNWMEKSLLIGSEIEALDREKAEVEGRLLSLEATVSKLEESANRLAVEETKLENTKARFDDNESKLKDSSSTLSEYRQRLEDCSRKASDAEGLRRDFEVMSAFKDEYNELSHRKDMFEQLIKLRLEQENKEIERLNREQASLIGEKENIASEIDKASSGLSTPILISEHKESIDELEKSAVNFGRLERDLEAANSTGHGREKLAHLKKSLAEGRRRLSSAERAVDETLGRLVAELPRLSVWETKIKDMTLRIDEIDNTLSEKRRSLADETLAVGEAYGKGPMNLEGARKIVMEYAKETAHIIKSGYDPATFDELKMRADEAISAREELAKIKEKIVDTEKTIEYLRKEQEILRLESSSFGREIEALQLSRNQYTEAREKLSRTQKEYNDLKEERQKKDGLREGIEDNLRSIASYKATITDLRNKQKEIEDEISDYRKLEEVFHRDGIPSAILKRIIPRVASESSSILAQLTDGRYDAITIEEQEDGRLNIWVKDGDQKYGVHRFSGGEKVRIALAVRLAVSKVLSELPDAGKRLSRMKTLIIDEGDLGSLDGEGLNSTIEIINDLTRFFGLTILISHLEAVKGWAGGNYVIVHRGNHGTGSAIEYG